MASQAEIEKARALIAEAERAEKATAFNCPAGGSHEVSYSPGRGYRCSKCMGVWDKNAWKRLTD